MGAIEVSVIIPTRNRVKDLGRCLEALSRQEFPREKFELIVCDDGSDDDVRSVVDEFKKTGLNLSYAGQAPKGPAAARNLGISLARGEIVAMTDSDTLPDKSWLKTLFDALKSNHDAIGVEGQVYADNEGEFDPLGEGPINKTGGIYLTCNCAYRRKTLVEIGGFDETFPYPAYEDTELAARAQQRGPIVWQPEAVVIHPQRPLTARDVMKKLRHWEYVLLMGFRYGYLAWKRYPVRHPRLRVAFLSVVVLPIAKFRTATSWFLRKPIDSVKLAGLGVIESVGALFLVAPKALFGNYRAKAVRKSYL